MSCQSCVEKAGVLPGLCRCISKYRDRSLPAKTYHRSGKIYSWFWLPITEPVSRTLALLETTTTCLLSVMRSFAYARIQSAFSSRSHSCCMTLLCTFVRFSLKLGGWK